MSSSIHNALVMDIPKIHNELGSLSVIEGNNIPFEIGKVHYLYDITNEIAGRSDEIQETFLVALHGSFEILLNDGQNEKRVVLNKPNDGLYIPAGIWFQMQNFSSATVCLIVNSKKKL